jgi:mutator protein MutT
MIRVLAAVIKNKDLLLVCQRPLHKRHGGLWEFPGGKIENDESELEAIRRELLEELGVHVTSVGPTEFYTQDPGSNFVIEFLPVQINGEPKCIEHSAHCWSSLEKLFSLPLAPSDRRYAEFLLNSRANNGSQ